MTDTELASPPDVGKLRELAEGYIAYCHANPNETDHDKYLLARGLLSVLNALEAAKRRARYEQGRALAWEVRGENAEASRDQAIKEREDWLVIVRAERDRLAEALARAAFVASHLLGMIDQDTWRAEGGDDGQGHYEGEYRAARLAEEIDGWDALAGVPGGPPEEHKDCPACGGTKLGGHFDQCPATDWSWGAER